MTFVRPASHSDLPTLSAIWHENRLLQQQFDSRLRLATDAPARWQSAAAAWIQSETVQMLAFEKEGRLLGYIVGQIEPAPPGLLPEWVGVVLELNVDAHARENRVGRDLLIALREWFAGRGIRQVAARIIGHSAVEQAFWRSQGSTDWMAWLWLKS
jgi:ribosomal protein S18 acetylase RimI-like enzyme